MRAPVNLQVDASSRNCKSGYLLHVLISLIVLHSQLARNSPQSLASSPALTTTGQDAVSSAGPLLSLTGQASSRGARVCSCSRSFFAASLSCLWSGRYQKHWLPLSLQLASRAMLASWTLSQHSARLALHRRAPMLACVVHMTHQ